MDVDEAGRHDPTVGIDGVSPGGDVARDGGDAPAVDGDVGRAPVGAGAVDDLAAADDEVVHGSP